MMLNSAVILLTLFSCIDGAQKHMASVLSPLSQKVVANISHVCPNGSTNGRCGPLYDDTVCGGVPRWAVYCNTENGWCGNTTGHRRAQWGMAYDLASIPSNCQHDADGWTCDGTTCEEINECVSQTDDCDVNAACTNTVGGWTCACNQGFDGDGTSCEEINECVSQTDDCDVNAACTNTVGGWTCACNQGLVGDGQSCASSDCWDFVPAGCVDNHNIILHKDKSVAECTVLCSENPECLAIEYGVSYGGSGNYVSRDCQLQDSAASGTCDGQHHNLDLYKKSSCPPAIIPTCWEWDFVPGGCVNGHNIPPLYHHKSVAECKLLCSENSDCLAIEYGVSYGGDGSSYESRDCQLQDSAAPGTCDGQHHNLDLYILELESRDCPQDCWDFVPAGCVDNHNIILHKDKSVAECTVLCSENPECLAIEYGVSYGGDGSYESRDCQLQDSAASGTCNGQHHNLDLYKKFSCPQDAYECVDNSCDANAACTNTVGALTCACNEGFAGDGSSCADIHECDDQTDDCDVNAACTNTVGRWTCACNQGFVGDGTSCTDRWMEQGQ